MKKNVVTISLVSLLGISCASQRPYIDPYAGMTSEQLKVELYKRQLANQEKQRRVDDADKYFSRAQDAIDQTSKTINCLNIGNCYGR